MSLAPVVVADGVRLGAGELVLVAGPCVVEGREITLRIADAVARAAAGAGLPAVFKASYDKANRTSRRGFRGIGIDEALAVLREVGERTGLPVQTDVHLPEQVPAAAEVAQVLQIPAFLCRQTDLLAAAGASGRPVAIKKGQFVAPEDLRHAADKATAAGAAGVILIERGTSFGYRDLVVDLRALPAMRALGHPVVFDATHSVQRPSAAGDRSGGDRRLVPTLLRGAVAAGVDGVFVEVHPDPDRARSDGPNSLPLDVLPALLDQVREIHALVRGFGDDAELWGGAGSADGA